MPCLLGCGWGSGVRFKKKKTVHLYMTDGNRSSGSAEQAENTVNVNCSLKKSAVLEIDLLWGEGQ